MSDRSVVHSTYVIERTYPVAPARVFAAFADPVRKRRWFGGEDDGSLEQFEMDFQPGGRERTTSRMNEKTPFPGVLLTNETVYQDIVPDRRIVLAYTMALGDRRISASLLTIELLPYGSGTRLLFTDQGAYFDGADGPERRQAGWGFLLDRLTAEVAE